MDKVNVPAKVLLPFANSGYKNTIPLASQIGIVAGKASLTDGFPPLTSALIAAGGKGPTRGDFNGILNQISANTRWVNAGNFYPFDATFASSISGYPAGAILASATGIGYWCSLIDANMHNPDTTTGYWTPAVLSNILYVDTIALLRLTPGSASLNLASVAGYYASADGGGGPLRKWDSGHAIGYFADDGASVIVPTGGDGSAAWVWNENLFEVEAAWFGIVADGATDELAIMNYAIEFCKSHGFIDLLLPPGTIVVSAPCNNLAGVLNNGGGMPNWDVISVRGAGMKNTIILCDQLSAGDKPLWADGGSGAVFPWPCGKSISELAIVGNGVQSGIEFKGISNFDCEHVWFRALAYGTVWNTDDGERSDFCVSRNCTYDTSVGVPFYFRSGTGTHVYQGSGFYGAIVGNSTSTSPTVQIGDIAAVGGIYLNNCQFDGHVFNNQDRNFIEVPAGNTGLINSIGNLTFESLAGAMTLGAGDIPIYHAGTVSAGKGPITLGQLFLVDLVCQNTSGNATVQLRDRKYFRHYPAASTTQTIAFGLPQTPSMVTAQVTVRTTSSVYVEAVLCWGAENSTPSVIKSITAIGYIPVTYALGTGQNSIIFENLPSVANLDISVTLSSITDEITNSDQLTA